MGYHSDRAIDMKPIPAPSTGLPGAAERAENHTARLFFIPAGKLATDGVWRYFENQAAALRAKRDYRSLAYRPTAVEYWNFQEQQWWGD